MLPSDEAERGGCRSAEQRARFSQITATRPAEPFMPVGLLTLELHIPDAHSLKDKRQIVRSLKDRLRRHFNVAVAEMEYQDVWSRSIIGVVTLSTAEQHVEESLQSVLREADRLLGPVLVNHVVEMI
jgi:uncharacterized protein YlxP (DUF503 family)